jgi:predicted ATPase
MQSTELNFLADLASDRRLRNLPIVIIGAYRDDEVDERHPVTIALELMKVNSVRLYTMEVLPFTDQELNELLFEVIGGNDETVQHASALGALLISQSEGNLILYLEVCLS